MKPHDSLHQYRKKRHFSKTPEPKGRPLKSKKYRYLIQKHAASHLHYDFRLELDGVLKSWAVPKGPSLNPHDKRLAVAVEDHPIAYGSFEGIIPKGQYGGGIVMLWDEGKWQPIGDPQQGLAEGKLEFQLQGKRLKGSWALVRMRKRDEDHHHNWLLIKHQDQESSIKDADYLLQKNITSIVSGRTMAEIGAAKDNIWQSKKNSVAEKTLRHITTKRAKQVTMPAFILPQLATLTEALPKNELWIHEIKFDGYRALTYFNQKKSLIFTRTGQNWTEKFAVITKALEKLPAEMAILDGEIVALNKNNTCSFKALQNTLSEKKQSALLQYYVFDLLYLNGKDLRQLPLLERKNQLQKLLKTPLSNRIIYSEHFSIKDDDFLQRICAMQLEGIVAKRIDAPYYSGRNKSWLKIKCHNRQEFVIGGFTLPTHAKRGIGALLIGYYENKKLIYAGKVGTGFNHEILNRLRKKLDQLIQKEKPFASITTDGKRGAHWVKPKLVCEVEFTEWTESGRLRHPSFQGLREDKPAIAVKRDALIKISKKAIAAPTPKPNQDIVLGGIKISHPQRIIYPDTKITKQQLAQYYFAVAGYILPYVKNRPLSIIRCPEGIGEPCFFQRHIAPGQFPYLYEIEIAIKDRCENYMMISDLKGLMTLIQWGVIELHPWGCCAKKPHQPNQIIFDLDPDPELPWQAIIDGAKEVRLRMQEFGLESFVKTTGGKGLHVVIPCVSHYDWGTIKAFSHAIAESMAHDSPKRYIAKASKAARKGKIFVDYLRNDLTATAIAPFSARARAQAPVALPIPWESLNSLLHPTDFTIESVLGYLANRKNDPWEDFFKVKQKIKTQHLAALKIKR